MFPFHSRPDHTRAAACSAPDVSPWRGGRQVATISTCTATGISTGASANLLCVSMMALLSGCSMLSDESRDAPSAQVMPAPLKIPEVRPATKPVKPRAPSAESLGQAPAVTLPATFLPPRGASEYQVWRCTPAQDLLMAFSDGQDARGRPPVSVATDTPQEATAEGWLRLWSRQHAYALGHVVSASGARYRANDAPVSERQRQQAEGGARELEVWFKGREATLHNARGNLECVQDDQRTIQIPDDQPLLVAQGHEPEWRISLDRAHNRMTVTASPDLLGAVQGKARVSQDATGADDGSSGVAGNESGKQEQESSSLSQLTLPYRVNDDGKHGKVLSARLPRASVGRGWLKLSLTPGACFDTMQGTPYPLTSELTLTRKGGESRDLSGCGEAYLP